MSTEEINYDFPEFQGLSNMTPNDKVVYLLKLVSRYSAVVDSAKKILGESTDYVSSHPYEFEPEVHVKSRTTSTVDSNMLAVAYPDAYKKLFDENKLLAKAIDIKNLGDKDVYDNVVSLKKSTWLEYKAE